MCNSYLKVMQLEDSCKIGMSKKSDVRYHGQGLNTCVLQETVWPGPIQQMSDLTSEQYGTTLVFRLFVGKCSLNPK